MLLQVEPVAPIYIWVIIVLGGILLLCVRYVWPAICLQVIGNKTGTLNTWLAWIPIANIYLMCKIARKSGWLTLLFFVPVVNIVILIIIWMDIANLLKMSSWWGVLMIIPGLNLIIIGRFAFIGKRNILVSNYNFKLISPTPPRQC